MRFTSLLAVTAAAAVLAAVPASAANKLIDINAEGLTAGNVTTWTNNGTLGGSFVLGGTTLPKDFGNTAAVATTVAGKSAVKFNTSLYTLQSSTGSLIGVSPLLQGKSKYTMSAWIQNSAPRYNEYYFAWGAAGDNQNAATSIGLTPNGKNGVAFSDGKGNPPGDLKPAVQHGGWGANNNNNSNLKWDATNTRPDTTVWRHVTIVNDGITEKLYIDNGNNSFSLVSTQTLQAAYNVDVNYTNLTVADATTNFFSLGNAFANTLQGDMYYKWNPDKKITEYIPGNPDKGKNAVTYGGGTWFTGSMASLQLWDGALTDTQVSALYITPSPEPGTLLALGTLLAPAGMMLRRRRK